VKPSLAANALLFLGIACMAASLFHQALGFSKWAPFVTFGLGASLMLCAAWIVRRAKKRGNLPAIAPTQKQQRKHVRLVLISFIAGCLLYPLYARYIDPRAATTPFYQLVLYSIGGCLFAVTIFLLMVRRRRPKV
jgi:hypothetical protein